MARTAVIVKAFVDAGADLFTGVPDSVIGDVSAACRDVVKSVVNVTTANEGNAVGLAAGWWLATGKPAVVYMQNSGLGNALNPLLSLSHSEVYAIPMVLLVGWRGMSGSSDEPQHRVQGRVTVALLDLIGLPITVLHDDEEPYPVAERAFELAISTRSPVVVLIPFSKTKTDKTAPDVQSNEWLRGDAIDCLLRHVGPNDFVIASTGYISRDLVAQSATHPGLSDRIFLCVGAMGHASQIAVGVALARKDVRVWCIDGDGAFIMHLGGATTIAELALHNLVHVVIDNHAHDSVGGSPTCAPGMSISQVARAIGYANVITIRAASESLILSEHLTKVGPLLVHVPISIGERYQLPRPQNSLRDLGDKFKSAIETLVL